MERDDPLHPLLGLQQTAGNRAVTEALGRTAGDEGPARASPASVQRLVAQRQGGGAQPEQQATPVDAARATQAGQAAQTDQAAPTGQAGQAPAGPGVPGAAGTMPAPPDSLVQLPGRPADDNAVSPEGQLASDASTVTITVIAHNFHARGGRLEILADPGISIQVTPGDAPQPVVQAAINILNRHLMVHGHEIELALAQQAQAGPGGVGTSLQAQAELHITTSFSVTASTTLGVSSHSDSPDPGQVRLAGDRNVDLNWQPISIGALWHLGGDEAPAPRGRDFTPAEERSLQAEAALAHWVASQLDPAAFTLRETGLLDLDYIVTRLYEAMRGSSADVADWPMEPMEGVHALPSGFSQGLSRAAQLLVQADPRLAHIRTVRGTIRLAGELRYIPIRLEQAADVAQPATAR